MHARDAQLAKVYEFLVLRLVLVRGRRTFHRVTGSHKLLVNRVKIYAFIKSSNKESFLFYNVTEISSQFKCFYHRILLLIYALA